MKTMGSQTTEVPLLAIVKRFFATGLNAVNTFSVNAFPFDDKSLFLESNFSICSCNFEIEFPPKLSTTGTSSAVIHETV